MANLIKWKLFSYLMKLYLLLISLVLLFGRTFTLHLHLDIPSIIKYGEPVWLRCDYNLEDDSLYSVKWYKNNIEFYRYMNEPVMDQAFGSSDDYHKFYGQVGIYVDLSKSNSTHVLLETTDLNTEGTYMAEVSTTTFNSVKRLKDMRIYVPPERGIQIIGSKAEYKLAKEGLNLTCVSAPSKPIQILGWFVNGHRVLGNEPRINLSRPDIDYSSDGLMSSSQTISLLLLSNDNHLSNGVLALRCSSIMTQIYGVNFEELVIEEHGRFADKQGVQQTEGDYESLGHHYSPPKIDGHSNRYSIGDIVDLNCSSTSGTWPPPLLEWSINGKDILNSQLIIYSKVNDKIKFSSTIYDNFAHFDDHRRGSVLGLRFQITKEHYQTSDGKLRLRCSATHATIISTDSTELTLFSRGRQSSLLFASDANIIGMAFGRIAFGAFLYYTTVAWINSI